MNIEVVDKNNFKFFQNTYITAMRDGFLDFVPNNFINNFNENFTSYYSECYDTKKTTMWLCKENDENIGVIVFGKAQMKQAQEFDAEIDSIYFMKNYCGKGFAGRVLGMAEKLLKKQGYKRVLLWCSKENARAWRFYIKNGYLPTTDKWNDELDGKIFHNILFVKEL